MMHIPFAPPALASDIANAAKRARLLVIASHLLSESDTINAADSEYDFTQLVDDGLILAEESGGGRFRSSLRFLSHSTSLEDLASERVSLEAHLNDLVHEAIGLDG